MNASRASDFGCCERSCDGAFIATCYGSYYYDCGQTIERAYNPYVGTDFVCDDECPQPRDCNPLQPFAIVSIVIGSLLLLALAALVARYCIRKRRERKFAALRNHTLAKSLDKITQEENQSIVMAEPLTESRDSAIGVGQPVLIDNDGESKT